MLARAAAALRRERPRKSAHSGGSRSRHRESGRRCFSVLQYRRSSRALYRIVGRMRTVGRLAKSYRRNQHPVRQTGRIVELKSGNDTGVDNREIVDRHSPVAAHGSPRSWLSALSRWARSSSTSTLGAPANIARTSSLGTARRRRMGIIRASGSPLSVSVYVSAPA